MAAAWARAARSRSGPAARRSPAAGSSTRRIQFAIFEGLDIGLDNGSPVDWTYKLPFKFTGRIDKVTVEVFPGK
jgi:hypothetical protein